MNKNTFLRENSYGRNCEYLLIHLYGLSQNTYLRNNKFQCNPTTKYLSKLLNKSSDQVKKYLFSLKQNNLIEIKTSKLSCDDEKAKLYKLRTISPKLDNYPKNYRNVMDIYFNKILPENIKLIKIHEITNYLISNNI